MLTRTKEWLKILYVKILFSLVFLSLLFISFSLYEISCTYTGGDYLYPCCAWNFVYVPLISVYRL